MLAPLRAFLRLSRLKFLAGGVLGVALGTAVAAYERPGPIDLLGWLLAQIAVSALQLMTHYANDFFDRDSDRLTTRTPFSGGSGALVDGSLSPAVGLVTAYICGLLGIAVTAVLFARGQTAAGALGLAIAALAWSYSAPPMRLLARGLGELDTALVVAVLVPLFAYAAQTGHWLAARPVASALPGAAAMFAMMLCVQAPDIAADAATGKRNLVVRFGRTALRRLGRGAIAAVYAGIGLALWAGAPRTLPLVELLSLPPAVSLWLALGRDFSTPDPPADAGLAARGVVFFFVVSLFALLGYVVAVRWRI